MLQWGTDGNLGPRVLELKGRMEYRVAMNLSELKDKDRKVQLLKDASTSYQNLFERFGKRPEIAAEARMSLAGIEESLVIDDSGSPDKCASTTRNWPAPSRRTSIQAWPPPSWPTSTSASARSRSSPPVPPPPPPRRPWPNAR